MPSPLCQSQDLRAMRSEGAGGQALLVHEIRLGFLVPGKSFRNGLGDFVV